MIRFGICNELFEGWDLAHTCHVARSLGYDGIELAPFTLAPLITDLSKSQRRKIRETIADADLACIGTHWLLAKTTGLHLTSPEGGVRAATADYLRALAEATHDFGGKLMVFGSPKQRDLLPGVNYHRGFDYAAEVFSSITPALTEFEVDLCIEPLAPNDTNFLTSIDQANDLVRRINHRHVVLHLDVKAMSFDPGGSITTLIAKHAAEAGHFHAQDPNLRGPGMGELDFGPIMRSLVASKYNKWVSVEVFDYTAGAEETAAQSIHCLRSNMPHA